MIPRSATLSLVQLPDDAIATTEQVAKYLGVSIATVRRSSLPVLRVGPRCPRYRVGDVRAWVREQTRGAA